MAKSGTSSIKINTQIWVSILFVKLYINFRSRKLIRTYFLAKWRPFCLSPYVLKEDSSAGDPVWFIKQLTQLWPLFDAQHNTSHVYNVISKGDYGSLSHYDDVIMTTMAAQITSLTVVYSTVNSDANQRKHQSSASLAFVWGIHRDRWIQCFHLMTSSCYIKTSMRQSGVYLRTIR